MPNSLHICLLGIYISVEFNSNMELVLVTIDSAYPSLYKPE